MITKIVGSRTGGLIAGSLALVLRIGLWHAYPLVAAYFRNRTAGEAISSAVSGVNIPASGSPLDLAAKTPPDDRAMVRV